MNSKSYTLFFTVNLYQPGFFCMLHIYGSLQQRHNTIPHTFKVSLFVPTSGRKFLACTDVRLFCWSLFIVKIVVASTLFWRSNVGPVSSACILFETWKHPRSFYLLQFIENSVSNHITNEYTRIAYSILIACIYLLVFLRMKHLKSNLV